MIPDPERGAVIVLYPPRVTRVLLVAIGVYFAMAWIAGGARSVLGGGGPQDLAVLTAFGANYGPLVADGDLWRLVASMFLHASLLHLAVNGYALYFLGRNLEAFYGPWGFLFIYMASGVVGSIASALFAEALSVGASGAIFGLLGASLVFAFRYRGALPGRVKRIMGTMLLPWVVLNVVLGILVPRIDMNAHLGGLVAGALIAAVLPAAAMDRSEGRHRLELHRILASLTLSLLFVSFSSAGMNIFRMRGESGALLDPRLVTLLEGDRELLVAELNQAIHENPYDASLLATRAQIHMLQEMWFEAIGDYQRAIEIEPENAGFLNNLAWILLEEAPEGLRNTSEADRLIEVALASAPDDPYVLGTYGTVRLRRGEAEAAAQYLQRAVDSNRPARENATDYYLLSIALGSSGAVEAAQKAFDQGVRLDPGNSYRGEAERALGNRIQTERSL